MDNNIMINCKELQLLLGVPLFEAKRIIYKYLPFEEKENIEDAKNIKVSHCIDYKRIDIRIKSFSERLDNKKEVKYIIDDIRKHGLPDRIKSLVLRNQKVIKNNKLYGNLNCLKKILTSEQYLELASAINRLHKEYVYNSKNLLLTT